MMSKLFDFNSDAKTQISWAETPKEGQFLRLEVRERPQIVEDNAPVSPTAQGRLPSI